MPNQITNDGIQTMTLDDIINLIVNGTDAAPGLKRIYGDDINIDSDTPDGQLVNIFALAVKDTLDLATQIYNSFDPDFAVGRVLDQRCAINGIERQGATYTETSVTVTTSRALTLPGLDKSSGTPFTVSDAEGNRFQLINTVAIPAPDAPGGTRSQDLMFRAAESGSVRCLPNTITRQVTITAGIVSVNNPSAPENIGIDEESDYDLRIRRSRALALPAVGTVAGIQSSLLETPGVTQAAVYENTTNETDADGIPGHSIWCIVGGGTDEDVARAIYMKRNAGCGMKGIVGIDGEGDPILDAGATLVPVEQEDGTFFNILFYRPREQSLYIKLEAETLSGGPVSTEEDLRTAILRALENYRINQPADITTIAKVAREAMSEVVVFNVGISTDGINYQALVFPDAKYKYFKLAEERIIINGEAGISTTGETAGGGNDG